MSRVTLTISLCFQERNVVQYKTFNISDDDTAVNLCRYLSTYTYGGLPVYLSDGQKKIEDNEIVKSFKGENVMCVPVKPIRRKIEMSPL